MPTTCIKQSFRFWLHQSFGNFSSFVFSVGKYSQPKSLRSIHHYVANNSGNHSESKKSPFKTMIFYGGKEREKSPSFGLKKGKTEMLEKHVNLLTQKLNCGGIYH